MINSKFYNFYFYFFNIQMDQKLWFNIQMDQMNNFTYFFSWKYKSIVPLFFNKWYFLIFFWHFGHFRGEKLLCYYKIKFAAEL